MTVISKGAVLKKKVGNDVYIYQPYTHIDYVEGGLDQAEIENLINSAGYLDTSAVNAILESYYTKTEVNNLLSYSGGDYITSGNVLNVIEQVDSLFGDMDSVIGDGSFGSNPNYIQKGTTITQAMVALDTQAKVNADGIQSINTNKANKATTLSGYGITNAYTKTEVDNKVTTLNNSITTTVNTHNSNTSAHSDIRNLISDLANRLNALANSDDTTLDQMAEVVAYIKSNRGLIEGITTTKANKDYVDTELGKKANSADLAKVATSGSYNDLSNKPTIPTTLPANGGNADTVGGFTVGVNVPANAKFTDTTYSAMSASEATTGTATTARSISAKVLNDKINAVVTTNAYTKTEVDSGLSNKLNTTGGNVTGHIYLTGSQANSSTSNTSQLVFGTEDNNHIAISSNNNALVINPNATSTTNQIVLYLDKASMFPNGISGNASSATKLQSNAGSATQPIYFSGGKPVACTYTLGASVPSNAEFTDTTYSNASQSASGLMSADDKKKLDGIATNANNYTYTLPTASSTLGGVKTTSTVTSTSGYTACPIISGVPYYKDTDTNTDTKVTNTLNTTAKAYVTGTTSASTNTGTQVFDTGVYLDTTAGTLVATTFKTNSGIEIY